MYGETSLGNIETQDFIKDMRPFKNVVRGFSLVRTTLKGRTTEIWE